MEAILFSVRLAAQAALHFFLFLTFCLFFLLLPVTGYTQGEQTANIKIKHTKLIELDIKLSNTSAGKAFGRFINQGAYQLRPAQIYRGCNLSNDTSSCPINIIQGGIFSCFEVPDQYGEHPDHGLYYLPFEEQNRYDFRAGAICLARADLNESLTEFFIILDDESARALGPNGCRSLDGQGFMIIGHISNWSKVSGRLWDLSYLANHNQQIFDAPFTISSNK